MSEAFKSVAFTNGVLDGSGRGTVNMPATVSAGDFLFCWFTPDTDHLLPVPADLGWAYQAPGVSNTIQCALWKLAEGTEAGGTRVFEGDGGAGWAGLPFSAMVACYSGLESEGPFTGLEYLTMFADEDASVSTPGALSVDPSDNVPGHGSYIWGGFYLDTAGGSAPSVSSIQGGTERASDDNAYGTSTVAWVLGDQLTFSEDAGAVGVTFSGYSGNATVTMIGFHFGHDEPLEVDPVAPEIPLKLLKVNVGELPYQLHTRMGDF